MIYKLLKKLALHRKNKIIRVKSYDTENFRLKFVRYLYEIISSKGGQASRERISVDLSKTLYIWKSPRIQFISLVICYLRTQTVLFSGLGNSVLHPNFTGVIKNLITFSDMINY